MMRSIIVGFVLFAFGSPAIAADLPRRQPVVASASVGKTPIGKTPIGKTPIGKTPIGKTPAPIVTKG